MPQSSHTPDHLEEIAYSDLSGWTQDDQSKALTSFLRFCAKPEALGSNPASVRYALADLPSLCAAIDQASLATNEEIRQFIEAHFTAYLITKPGFVTGYFEPEVPASRTRSDRFSVPLHKKPTGLEALTPETRPTGWPEQFSHGRRVGSGFEELPDRSAIMDGALDAEQLELVWLADPIDAYFIHVQGSARLRLSDGSVMRVGYAGKSGHPYTGIGRLLVKRGEGTPEDFTMAGLRSWLAADPHRRDALFRENRSYIFFREVTETGPDEGPIGAAGLPLTPGRSLAVDPEHLPYGTLVFVEAGFPDADADGRDFSRLMVADDTGSAIRGPVRGDIFTGSGDPAGDLAGEIRHQARFTILVPKRPGTGAELATD